MASVPFKKYVSFRRTAVCLNLKKIFFHQYDFKMIPRIEIGKAFSPYSNF